MSLYLLTNTRPFLSLKYTQNPKYGNSDTQKVTYIQTHTLAHILNIGFSHVKKSLCTRDSFVWVPAGHKLTDVLSAKIPVGILSSQSFLEGSATCTLQLLLQVFLHTGVSAMYIEIKPQSVNANPTHTYVRRTVLFLDKNHREVSSKFFTKLEMFSKIKNFPLKRG